MNVDQTHRIYRWIEVKVPDDLRSARRGLWPLVDGWLELAELREPGSDKAIIEGDYVVHLPDGSIFKEVSFKTGHPSVADALPDWSASVGRRWGKIVGETFVRSDNVVLPLTSIRIHSRTASSSSPS
jgi:hypothetical protein